MKKIYSIFGLLAIAVSVNAQTGAKATNKSNQHSIGTPLNGITTTTTTMLTPASALGSCTLTAYGSATLGYVSGTNTYADLQKGQKYALSTYTLTTPATVTAVSASFARVVDAGNGSNLVVNVYGVGTGTALGHPGALLGTSNTVALASATTGTALTNFTFAAPVALTSDSFYVFVDIGGLGAGDTIAVYQSNFNCGANFDGAWEQWSDNTFHSFSDPANWGSGTADLMIFPNVTATTGVGIKTNSLNSANITVSPNPSNGIVNVSLALSNKENITISLSNALGQVVSTSNYSSIGNDVISLDLSSQNNGVYFVTISNGKDKMVKKVVLNK